MNDIEKALEACRTYQSAATYIDHPAARVIASMYHDGQGSPTYALASTGFIPGEVEEWTHLVRMILSNLDDSSSDEEILIVTMLVQYILRRVQDDFFGAVPGWSSFWL